MYDMSGQGRYRQNWNDFYAEVDGIFFVVDATDHMRLSIVQELLLFMADDKLLMNSEIPVLLVFNKMDNENALSSKEILAYLEFDQIKAKNPTLKWGVEETIFIKEGVGIAG